MRAKGVDLRKNVEVSSSGTKKAHFHTNNRQLPSGTSPLTITINDLPDSEKLKITKLAEKVIELNGNIDQLQQQIELQRIHHADEIKSIHATIEGQISIIEDRLKLKDGTISQLQNKEQMITSMLALYQAKLKNMADICQLAGDNEEYNKKKVGQLQADLDHYHIVMQNQKKLIESFDETKAQLEERTKSMELRYTKRIKSLEEIINEETDRRLRAEKLSLQQSSENVSLKSEIQRLNYQLQQLRAMHMSSHEQETMVPRVKLSTAQTDNVSSSNLTAAPLALSTAESNGKTNRSHTASGDRISQIESETNPFKKYGPYDEYSLLFNNSRADESYAQSPPLKKTDSVADSDSPIPTPATTKFPFDTKPAVAISSPSTDSGSSPSREIISQSEDLLRRSRNVQLLSTGSIPTNSDQHSSRLSFPNTVDSDLPPIKPADRDPIETKHHRNSAAASQPPQPPQLTSQSYSKAAFYPRDSRDSVISSVGIPDEGANYDGKNNRRDDQEDESEEASRFEDESSDEHDDEVEDEEEEETISFDPTTTIHPSPETDPFYAVKGAKTNNNQLVATKEPVAVATSKHEASSFREGDSRLSDNTEKKLVKKKIHSKNSALEENDDNFLRKAISSQKAFYPMRPLSANSAAADNVKKPTSPATTGMKRKKKKLIKSSKENENLSRLTKEDVAQISAAGEEANVRVSKVKKVKKQAQHKAKPNSQHQDTSLSFLSNESKDAVALLHREKDPWLSESVTYLPRPPPRSATKSSSAPTVTASTTSIKSSIDQHNHPRQHSSITPAHTSSSKSSKILDYSMIEKDNEDYQIRSKVGNNLHYSVISAHKYDKPKIQRNDSKKGSKQSSKDRFDSSLFDLVDALEREQERGAPRGGGDDTDTSDD